MIPCLSFIVTFLHLIAENKELLPCGIVLLGSKIGQG